MATLSRFDEELKALERDIKEHKEQITQADLDGQKLEHDIQGFNSEKTKSAAVVKRLEISNEWIATDKE